MTAIEKEVDRSDTLLEYDQFRTGLTYGQVYHFIFNRKHKRRNGVLGYWRELKQKMYLEYQQMFFAYKGERGDP